MQCTTSIQGSCEGLVNSLPLDILDHAVKEKLSSHTVCKQPAKQASRASAQRPDPTTSDDDTRTMHQTGMFAICYLLFVDCCCGLLFFVVRPSPGSRVVIEQGIPPN
jgi:hypothetical protein